MKFILLGFLMTIFLFSNLFFNILPAYSQFESPITLSEPIPSNNDHFGFSVSTGDVNNDGIDDVIIAVGDPSGSGFASAEFFVFLGPDLISPIEISDPDFQIRNDFSGVSGVTADVDGDGDNDIVVGSHASNAYGGRVYVLDGPDFITSSTLANTGESNFGNYVAIGDINGDTIPDVIVGASVSDSSSGVFRAGKVVVFFGGDLINRIELDDPTPTASGAFGTSVASGDIDGNGLDDVIVGTGSDEAFVFFGDDLTRVSPLLAPATSEGIKFGVSVTAGNVNGDQYDDVIVGAPATNHPSGTAGEIFVFLGPDLTSVTTVTEPTRESSSWFGNAVATGDIDNDGDDDVIVGAASSAVNPMNHVGEAFVFNSPSFATVITLPSPIPTEGAYFGLTVSSGDINDDGCDDVIIGAPLARVNAEQSAGKTFVYKSIAASECRPDVGPIEPLTTITVIKKVINDDYRSATASDFRLFINSIFGDSTQVLNGRPNPVSPGKYTITEQGPSGYSHTFSGDCDSNGNIAIKQGERLECIIINNDSIAGPPWIITIPFIALIVAIIFGFFSIFKIKIINI